jgi:hypothetical protein
MLHTGAVQNSLLSGVLVQPAAAAAAAAVWRKQRVESREAACCPPDPAMLAELAAPLLAVCRQRPAGIRQAAWPANCKNVAAGGKCFAKCKPGFTGAGATAQCTPQGWSKPNVQCVSTARNSRVTTPKTAGAAANAAAAAAGLTPRARPQAASSTQSAMRMQAPQQSNRQIYRCQNLPAAVAGAVWGPTCAGLSAGRVCTARCKGSGAAGFTTVCKASGDWTNPQGGGCGPASKGGLQESGVSSQQAFMQLPAAEQCRGAPAAVRGAVWATCNGFDVGQSCTAACNERGTVGEYTSVCLPDGTW